MVGTIDDLRRLVIGESLHVDLHGHSEASRGRRDGNMYAARDPAGHQRAACPHPERSRGICTQDFSTHDINVY
jgi:hypothetical protein